MDVRFNFPDSSSYHFLITIEFDCVPVPPKLFEMRRILSLRRSASVQCDIEAVHPLARIYKVSKF